MKKTGLLHPELSFLIASLGHGDMLVIADAGLPIPENVNRIDLAFAQGKPAFMDVLDAVLSEFQVESAVIASELTQTNSAYHDTLVAALPINTTDVSHVPHEDFKNLTYDAKVIVRTGEFTPYANVILKSGVTF